MSAYRAWPPSSRRQPLDRAYLLPALAMVDRFFSTIVFFLLLVTLGAPRFAAAQEEVEIEREVTASREKAAKRIDCEAAPDDQVVGDELTVRIRYPNNTDETQTLQVTHDGNPDDPEAYDLLEESISVTNGTTTSDDDANTVTYDFEVPPMRKEPGRPPGRLNTSILTGGNLIGGGPRWRKLLERRRRRASLVCTSPARSL